MTRRLPGSSRSTISAVPANRSLTGPMLIPTRPAYLSSPRSSVSSAPGRQAATPGMSWKDCQTVSSGWPTSKEFLRSIQASWSAFAYALGSASNRSRQPVLQK